MRAASCDSDGARVGGAAAYQPLRTNAHGSAEGEAVLSDRLESGGNYMTVVLEGATGEILACGELSEK